jgi:hypothetical protein
LRLLKQKISKKMEKKIEELKEKYEWKILLDDLL